VRRYIVHTLARGGDQHGGFDALDYRNIKHEDAGKLGKYAILSVLPDNFAMFSYEFHDFWFSSLDLPPLPADKNYLVQYTTIRYGSCCICAPVINMLVFVII
jgi:hypothetical protein